MSNRHKSFRNYESGSSKRKSAQEKEKKAQEVFAKSRKISAFFSKRDGDLDSSKSLPGTSAILPPVEGVSITRHW